MSTFKMITAAISAIMLADLLQLEFVFSAGVIAILTIQPTKRETVYTALGRLYAFLFALVLAWFSYGIFGYSVGGYLVYLVLLILMCRHFGWDNAISMNAVLISHFISHGIMNLTTIVNEVLIFSIGVSIGIIANLHLRKRVDYVERLKKEADEQIMKILVLMSQRILNKVAWNDDDDYFQVLEKQIREAMNVAEENYNNQFDKDDIFDMEYIRMRENQCQILYEMYKNVRSLNSSPDTAETISDFLKRMAQVYHRDNRGRNIMEQFREMNETMKSRPLPVTRKEFEDRARLFVLMRSMEEFIQIKMEFAKIHLAFEEEEI